MNEFFICLISGIKQNNYYFVWSEDYILTKNNKIIFFYSLNDCIEYIKKININITDFNDIFVYDIKKIMLSLTKRKFEYKNVLNFINIIDDMYNSVGKNYEYGCNNDYFMKTDEKLLLSSTFLGNGKNYPLTSKEKRMVRKLIRTGLYFLNEQISQS